MTRQTPAEFARELQKNRMLGERPALLLGAGAPVGAGLPLMRDLMQQAFDCATFEEFCEKIDPLTDNQRFARLFDFLQNREKDPLQVTPGFRALASLVKSAFFDLVLTTNFDPLLEDALANDGLRRRDYLLLVNPLIASAWYETLLTNRFPLVKIVKLHGDLFHRAMAWTPQEMEATLKPIAAPLGSVLSTRDLVVAGHSLNDSKRIRGLVEKAIGAKRAIWYVNLSDPPPWIQAYKYLHTITGDEGKFETFFTTLTEALQPTRAATISDALAASTVGIAITQPWAECTGFVIRDPHVIVSDAFPGQNAVGRPSVTVITADGRRFKTVTRKTLPHPFGPWVLDVPPGLDVAGLHVSADPVTRGTRLRAAVAAGEKLGLSSGTVTGPETSVNIAPIGPVDHLIPVEMAVAPGSSGAPVVDDADAVKGFVVAGSADVTKPLSFIYPAARWAKEL